MHQPFYFVGDSRVARMPWPRLHATKGYYDMLGVLLRHPGATATVNLTPSLVLQLEMYAAGASDVWLELSRKAPDSLTHEEKVELLSTFFMANWETMVEPIPRYRELLEKRGRTGGPEVWSRSARDFTAQDILDLQVLFNLAWFGYTALEEDPRLRQMREKPGFSEEDRAYVLEAQRRICGRVLEGYRKAWEGGALELSTTPLFHPIIPLLIDTAAAREALPEVRLPKRRFRHPEDASAQIELACAEHERLFGRRPEGMWPSEGAVSQDAVPLFARAGISWIATDEGVLRGSRGAPGTAGAHLFPYLVEEGDTRINIFFRDRELSDLIGFSYSRMAPEEAASDFLRRCEVLAERVSRSGEPALIPVILDGENPWEYFPDGGRGFLEAVYSHLPEHPKLGMTDFTRFIKEHPARRRLARIRAGSWIESSFGVWIGGQEENTAWTLLARVREEMEKAPPEAPPGQRRLAMRSIYAAEGSDWFWWYGERFSTDNDPLFDELFRAHLASALQTLGLPVPRSLSVPIVREAAVEPSTRPTDLIRPVLDGRVTSYYEWVSAGRFDVASHGGTMHMGDSLVTAIRYGFDPLTFYLRVDFSVPPEELARREASVRVEITHPEPVEVRLPLAMGVATLDGAACPEATVAFEKVMEAGVPFACLKAAPGDEVRFVVSVHTGEVEHERWPRSGFLSFVVPEPYYEQMMWRV